MQLKIYTQQTLENIVREVPLSSYEAKIPNGFCFKFESEAKRQAAIDAVSSAYPNTRFDIIGNAPEPIKVEPPKQSLFSRKE